MKIVTQNFFTLGEEEREKGRQIANATQGRTTHLPNQRAVERMEVVIDSHKKTPAAYAKENLGIPYHKRRAASAIARFYNFYPEYEEGINYDALNRLEKRIGFFIGAQQAYSVIIRAILKTNAGRKLSIFTQRGYPNYNPTTEDELRGYENRYRIHSLSLDDPGYTGTPTISDLENALNSCGDDIPVLLLTNPSNPEGKFLGAEMHVAIPYLMVTNPNLHVIFDESFIEMNFIDDGVPPEFATAAYLYTGNKVSVAATIGQMPHLQERITILRSGTKTAGLAVERLSLAVLPDNDDIIEAAAGMFSRGIYSAPESCQAGMEGWLDAFHKAPKKATGDLINYYSANYRFLSDSLKSLGISTTQPDGGFFTLLDFSKVKDKEVSPQLAARLGSRFIRNDEDIARMLLYAHPQKGLSVITGSACHYDAAECKVRFCFGLTPEDMKLAVEVIEFSMANLKSRNLEAMR